MDIPKEKRIKRYHRLPKILQEAMSSEESVKIFQNIAKKHELQIDQTGKVAEQVSFVILGFAKAEDFVTNLKKKLHLSDEKIQTITKDLNEQIFAPIKKELVETYKKDFSQPQVFEEKHSDSSTEREQILKDIEDPVEPSPIPDAKPKTLLDDKLGNRVKLPKEEKRIDHREKDWKQPLDPYREPTE